MGKDRERRQYKINIPMCLACVLFCLTLVSMHMTSGLYAKYTAGAEGSDDARVAKFEVTQTGIQTSDLMEIPMGTESITVQVVNDSEVAVNNRITLENVTKNIPVTVTNVSENLDVDKEAIYTVMLTWPSDTADYMGMVDYIQIKLITEQID